MTINEKINFRSWFSFLSIIIATPIYYIGIIFWLLFIEKEEARLPLFDSCCVKCVIPFVNLCDRYYTYYITPLTDRCYKSFLLPCMNRCHRCCIMPFTDRCSGIRNQTMRSGNVYTSINNISTLKTEIQMIANALPAR